MDEPLLVRGRPASAVFGVRPTLVGGESSGPQPEEQLAVGDSNLDPARR